MTDQMALAALAHGGLVEVEGSGWIHEDEHGNRGSWWSPRTSDGDALRLAVKLEMDVFVRFDKWTSVEAAHVGMIRINHSEIDPYAATREAIFQAAVRIGEHIMETGT